MHDGLQIGALAAILVSILLNRYDFMTLRKETNERMDKMGSKMDGRIDKMELKMDGRMESLRSDVHRSTALVTELLFQHAERITRLEGKS